MNNYVMCLIILNLYENKLFVLVVLVQLLFPINANVLVMCCLVLVIVMMSCHLNVLLVVRVVFLRVYFGLIEVMDYFVEKKRWLADQYFKFFNTLGIQFFLEPAHCHSNYWLNAILCNNLQNPTARGL